MEKVLIKVKEIMKEKTTHIAYECWISNLNFEKEENDRIILIAKSSIQKDMIESRFQDLLNETFEEILKRKCNILIKTIEFE